MFVDRAAAGIAAAVTALPHLDAIVFTGGVGEHAPRVRDLVCEALGFLGAAIDPACNVSCDGEAIISVFDARVAVLVVPAQENWMVARESVRLIPRRELDASFTSP
jgi:acetate kinase